MHLLAGNPFFTILKLKKKYFKMKTTIKFKIDGKLVTAEQGKTIVEAAKENGIYIPTLCNFEGIPPKGCCRMCTIKINNRYMTACTTPAADGMEIQSNTDEINDIRKGIIEILFVTGNHFCPSCEKSGNCVTACPYNARYRNPAKRIADKCDFCEDRLKRGKEPACVVTCPTKTRVFGDMNDPESPVAQMVKKEKTPLKPNAEQDPAATPADSYQSGVPGHGPAAGIFAICRHRDDCRKS